MSPMSLTHMMSLYRNTEGDLPNMVFPVFDAADTDAIEQAKVLLAARFTQERENRLKPTQAIVSRSEIDGPDTPIHRLALYSADDVRSIPLEQEPANRLNRTD